MVAALESVAVVEEDHYQEWEEYTVKGKPTTKDPHPKPRVSALMVLVVASSLTLLLAGAKAPHHIHRCIV